MNVTSATKQNISMRNVFRLASAALLLVFIVFVAAGPWFKKEIYNLGTAIGLAGSERRRTVHIVHLPNKIVHAPPEKDAEFRFRLAGEILEFRQVLEALRDGSARYMVSDATHDESTAQKLPAKGKAS